MKRGIILGMAALTLVMMDAPAFAAGSCRALFVETGDAYKHRMEALAAERRQEFLGENTPITDKAFDSKRMILRASEKEGLFYEEIAEWFPTMKPEAKVKFKKRLEAEKAFDPAKRVFTRWLETLRLEETHLKEIPLAWGWMKAQRRMEFLLGLENPFAALSVKDRQSLFDFNVLTFDDLLAGPKAPKGVTVGDDLGSYEVRSTTGIADRRDFNSQRAEIEKYLEGMIGHQHFFHGWSKDAAVRERYAPYYMETLDSMTWFLFWRQMNRNPREVDSILTHPFLGVYTRESLDRLHEAVVTNQAKKFKDKYRMVGARAFKATEEQAEFAGEHIPDWEARSGNKGVKREFLETVITARLATGDFTGMRDYRSYEFNPSAKIEELGARLGLSAKEIELLEQFELLHPAMKYSESKLAKNHVRNRITSPMLPWENRLELGYKLEHLRAAQRAYAKGVVKVAMSYKEALRAARKDVDAIAEARQDAVDALEKLIFQFSQRVRLDLDLESYLTPRARVLPDISVPTKGPIDVNKLPLGIEYSFRFPWMMKPENRAQADKLVKGLATMFSTVMEYEAPVSRTNDGHGHGIAVKYGVSDKAGDTWRFEWDGIQRAYEDGKVTEVWGGHSEVVTPKFVPEEAADQIQPLYVLARQLGMHPQRNAGGAHVNFDLGALKKLPVAQGTRALTNLISYFESNQELILFMWQHPSRTRAAAPVVLHPELAKKLEEFNGNWESLGRLLYEYRYFNQYETRKPKYVPLNLTALMTSIVPGKYLEKTLDIRNDKQRWFPNFAKVYSRGEARFFDAPTDEFSAALQIKYWRALLNRAMNSPRPIKLKKKFSLEDNERWKTNPDQWIKEANEHLAELGLDPAEFQTLLWESFGNRKQTEMKPIELKVYDGFLPAEKKERAED